jgi:hypothetical protein
MWVLGSLNEVPGQYCEEDNTNQKVSVVTGTQIQSRTTWLHHTHTITQSALHSVVHAQCSKYRVAAQYAYRRPPPDLRQLNFSLSPTFVTFRVMTQPFIMTRKVLQNQELEVSPLQSSLCSSLAITLHSDDSNDTANLNSSSEFHQQNPLSCSCYC